MLREIRDRDYNREKGKRVKDEIIKTYLEEQRVFKHFTL